MTLEGDRLDAVGRVGLATGCQICVRNVTETLLRGWSEPTDRSIADDHAQSAQAFARQADKLRAKAAAARASGRPAALTKAARHEYDLARSEQGRDIFENLAAYWHAHADFYVQPESEQAIHALAQATIRHCTHGKRHDDESIRRAHEAWRLAWHQQLMYEIGGK